MFCAADRSLLLSAGECRGSLGPKLVSLLQNHGAHKDLSTGSPPGPVAVREEPLLLRPHRTVHSGDKIKDPRQRGRFAPDVSIRHVQAKLTEEQHWQLERDRVLPRSPAVLFVRGHRQPFHVSAKVRAPQLHGIAVAPVMVSSSVGLAGISLSLSLVLSLSSLSLSLYLSI